MTTINQWPELERPREKLIANGVKQLTDSELLAIFIRTGRPGLSAVDLAREVLLTYGGLRPLLEAPCLELARTPGLGPATWAQLQGGLELGRRYLAAEWARGDSFSSPAQPRQYLQARLGGYQHEVFACLFLDNQHRLIQFEELFQGTIDGAAVYPREVVKRVLALNAAAVIFAHNHPSGVAEPSQADRLITKRLVQALSLIDVRVLDHFVVGGSDVVSMAEMNALT